ncbi:MAG: YlbF family regulator [[Eubacterium] brachy]|mgnify:FL=1|jgi:UPF0342 protein STH1710|nr:hypothetical protein HMPREF9089_00238 [Eubacterium brachy ATCC 33089]MBF1133583.1 YlbF family regulator [[Eubacterium] brachy]
MNVYEEAHNLSRAIKESEEYKHYKAAADKLKEKPELDKMIKDFMEKQIKIQTKQMLGEAVEESQLSEIQRLSAIVMQDPLAAEYMQCQMRFSIMAQDVYTILGETLNLK